MGHSSRTPLTLRSLVLIALSNAPKKEGCLLGRPTSYVRTGVRRDQGIINLDATEHQSCTENTAQPAAGKICNLYKVNSYSTPSTVILSLLTACTLTVPPALQLLLNAPQHPRTDGGNAWAVGGMPLYELFRVAKAWAHYHSGRGSWLSPRGPAKESRGFEVRPSWPHGAAQPRTRHRRGSCKVAASLPRPRVLFLKLLRLPPPTLFLPTVSRLRRPNDEPIPGPDGFSFWATFVRPRACLRTRTDDVVSN
nr:unnamed protein product [Digitaria exilis]